MILPKIRVVVFVSFETDKSCLITEQDLEHHPASLRDPLLLMSNGNTKTIRCSLISFFFQKRCMLDEQKYTM